MKHLKTMLCGILALALTLTIAIGPLSANAASTSNEQTVYNYLSADMGLSNAAACGIMANIKHESGYSPTAGSSSMYGICQWCGNRLTNLKSYCNKKGLDYTSLKGQLAFMKYELENGYSDVLSAVKTVGNSADGASSAAYKFCMQFERPAAGASEASRRASTASNSIWPKYKDAKGTSTTSVTVTKLSDGNWYSTQNGQKINYTGFAKNKNGWWYVKNGKVDFSVTDVIKGKAKGTTAWWNVVNSKITAGPTLGKNSKGWWYIDKSGKVDFSYTGFVKYNNCYWYVKDGKVDFSITDIIKDGTDGNWYNVVNSKVTAGPTVAKNSNGWWYIDKNGKVDFNFTGIAKNSNGKWKMENGKVNFNYTGRYFWNNHYYWIKNGKVV